MRLLTCFLLLLSLSGCSVEYGPGSSLSGIDISTVDASQAIVVDVRSQSEWESGHLKQAVHIPHNEIGERIDEVTSDKSALIVLHCKKGGRAGKAMSTLEGLGFTNVINGGSFDDMQKHFE